MQSFSYLFIDILTILFPIILSFDKKMYFYSKWKYAFKSIIISGSLFLVLDFIFTYSEVLGFDSNNTLGLNLLNLPIEEVLFIFAVPFFCLFIYESSFFLLQEKIKKGVFYQISLIAGFFLFFAGTINYQKLYTSIACIGSSLILAYHVARKKQMSHEIFWISYVIILVPLTVIYAMLTGSISKEPTIWYNNSQNIDIRILSIPIEYFAYSLFMLLLNVTLYERFLGRLYNTKGLNQ